MARRAKVESSRLRALLGIMRREDIAPREHVITLARELDRMHGTSGFGDCQSMGELTAMHISLMLDIKPAGDVWESPDRIPPEQ
jgi:hypothetical protein